ncbi:hypothetical protein WKR88_17425 [Trinickia caryophylli]|uniref:Uncharacterized protein n=1 Tax=Trinickia caryophylli TaxID=28094 RepID=A0A1X7G4Z8_TRICW|nr:hypothetical protein [Trinickia caryophylli]PMS13759.1 hypothetical protein C0Z17_02480 [Trinickia caryophylli]TRX14259.1 hypothetical protein FNF07_23470 [Trinickia caryophylli]WQE14088.1 hypothetical protein U0034_25665 [Trinickia caryophylli]SMF63558.1 hypothetical protein SAMN06295900_113112 [Trinickia caryophylli]GLU33418.1 hypothetical protein Busp01_32600 [Trinickia caryophylli]
MKKLTPAEVTAGLNTALEAGRRAGNSRIQELKQQAEGNHGQPVREECGNAAALVKLDGRSSLARAIKNASDTGLSLVRMGSTKFRGHYAVHARPEIQGDAKVSIQNCSIHEKAAEAIAESLKETFGFETSVLYWRN